MSYSSVILATSGLNNYWHLDETSGTTATDSKGTANGTYTGGFTLAQAGLASGTSVSFNGTSGFVLVNPTPDSSTTSRTLEAWFKRASTSTHLQPIVMNGALSSNGYGLLLVDGAQIWIPVGGKSWQNTGFVINDTLTHHGVVTLNASHVPEVFIDGQSIFIGTDPGWNTPTTFQIGGGNDGSSFFNGTLDEAALYTSQLSQATILDHFNAAGLAPPSGVKKGRFLASGDFLQCRYNTSFVHGSDNYLTVSLTIKTTQTGSNKLIFADADGHSRAGITIWMTSGVINVGAVDAGGGTAISFSGPTVNDGSIHTLVLRFGSQLSSVTDIWMDGVQTNTTTASGVWAMGANYVRWGLAVDTFWASFIGSFYPCGFWSRKLTDAEAKLVSKGALPTAFPNALKACWQMGGYGPYEIDEVGGFNAWCNAAGQDSSVAPIGPGFTGFTGGNVMAGAPNVSY